MDLPRATPEQVLLLEGALERYAGLIYRWIAQADLVLAAKGSLDGQTPFGKIPADAAHRAKKRDLPVIVLAGTVGKGGAPELLARHRCFCQHPEAAF